MPRSIIYNAVIIGFSVLTPVKAQLLLNEVMASNTRAYPDITDFEDYPDWIELKNESNSPISLADHYLSDDPDDPLKWKFADDATIGANEFLVVIADGFDTPKGQSFRRSSHGRPSYTTEKHHTNFKLSSAGERVDLVKVSRIPTSFVERGYVWSYLNDGADLGRAWRVPDFDDSSWESGAAPLGYADPVTTEISFGDDPDNKPVTTYFRTSFEQDGGKEYTDLILTLVVDDAAVVYLNDQEIFIDFETRALEPITPDLEERELTFEVSEGLLVEGRNVITVEVHQISPNSVDLRFDLSLEANEIQQAVIVDSLIFPQQVSDVSFGRDPNSPDEFVQFAESTPGAANGGPIVDSLRESSGETEILPEGGLKTDPVMVSLSSEGGPVYYTLDGGNPSSASLLYSEPFEITETTVIRARSMEEGKVPGAITTKTYFFGESFDGLPILSVVADPETLFGDEIGIYYNRHEERVGIGPSVYKGKDAPGHLEFFPVDGSEGFAVNGGVRIGGENNWASHAQRALNFSLRGRYGDDSIDYDLFPGSGIPSFTALTLREGGDDYEQARLTDAIFDSIVRGRMEVESNRFRPSVLFINGEYWGHYNIRGRWDDNWFYQHYGTNDGEYDRINLGNGGVADHGTTEEWNELLSFLDDNDVTQDDVWAEVERLVDVTSAADFVIIESYGRNSSWGGNREIWRDHRPGGKWRYLIPDMDRTFGNTRDSSIMSSLINGDTLISRIQENQSFRRVLAQRLAVHLATTLEADRVRDLIDLYSDQIAGEMSRQTERWGEPGGGFSSSVSRMRSFASARESGMLNELASVFQLTTSTLVTEVESGQGSFELEGIPFEGGSLGVYRGLGIKVKAVPAPGYRFDGWVGREDEQEFELTLNIPVLLEAQFVAADGGEISGTLAGNRTLTAAGSPYAVTDDLIVPSGTTLTIEAGARLEFERGINLRVQGRLLVQGSEASPVSLGGRNGARWGGISFEETAQTEPSSVLSHFELQEATRGFDPVTYPYAISGLDSNIEIEFMRLENSFGPVFCRGGELVLQDSFIHIPVTGDGINVKQGSAQTIRCTFLGNSAPDTDAIDYDGVVDGVIRDCRIYRFFGFNSDGIDTGEACQNVLVEGNRIFFCSDKGISVGQGSTIVARDNLIVGCFQGMGVKDEGSFIRSDQNTFVDCQEGISVFEKNFAAGGGEAEVINTIFAGSNYPILSDTFSNVTARYSLSDTEELLGENNLLVDPGFTDDDLLDFSLVMDSPAKDSGDPLSALDPDGSRADRGARYVYDPDDYPFRLDNTVVINEVLANSGLDEFDWVELHNRSDEDVDLSGWFLSDDGSRLDKYRIADGTIIPAGEYLVFYEDMHFGEASADPGRLVPFALSDLGETVHLSSATSGVLTDYRFREKFGASREGQSLGFYFKQSTESYNFVAMESATPADENADPFVGPLVISEIMYDPVVLGASEYLEILNVTDDPVEVYDFNVGRAWALTDGVEFSFPFGTPALQPGERVVIARDVNGLTSYGLGASVRTFQWASGRLANGGETVQISEPTEPSVSVSEFIRVDRVNYDNDAPWPFVATGNSLHRVIEGAYGNDSINWMGQLASPGALTREGGFAEWLAMYPGQNEAGDLDGDGLSNLLEYAIGTNPAVASDSEVLQMESIGGVTRLSYLSDGTRQDVTVRLERSSDLDAWFEVPSQVVGVGADGRQLNEGSASSDSEREFFRIQVSKN